MRRIANARQLFKRAQYLMHSTGDCATSRRKCQKNQWLEMEERLRNKQSVNKCHKTSNRSPRLLLEVLR